jgi:DNA-directed RNA polymerase subunit RPC12/RpoP
MRRASPPPARILPGRLFLDGLFEGAASLYHGWVADAEGTEMGEQRAETLSDTVPFRCEQCGEIVTLTVDEPARACPSCGSPALAALEMPAATTGGTTAMEEPTPEDREAPTWLGDPAALLGEPGEYICFEDAGEVVVVPLTREWTRIGRGLAADVRFDDPTVSRRHALIVRGADGLRVLDDRSLNGVFVNGARVEWSPLAHGDEIRVGRHRLYYATLEPVDAATPPPTTTTF